MKRALAVILAAVGVMAFAAVVGAALLAVLLIAWGSPRRPFPYTPAADFKQPVEPALLANAERVRDAMRGHARAADLAHVYRRLSDTFAREEVVTTEQVRLIHQYVGEQLREDDPAMVVPGELDQVEALVASHTGIGPKQIPNQKLTQDLRQRVVEAFSAISWACWDAGKMFADAPPPDRPQGLQPAENDVVEGLEEGAPLQLPEAANARGPPNFGLVPPSQEEREEFEGKVPSFGTLSYPSGEGKTRLLYRALLLTDPGAFTEKQTCGDCVSHAARNAVDTHRAFQIVVAGDTQRFVARGATEPIYAARGSSRDAGMTIYRAAKSINEDGYALRIKHGDVDMSRYRGDWAVAWGGSGVPSIVREAMRPHPVGRIASVQSVEEARDAIASGFPIFVGSDYGFSSKRDKYGFAQRRGTWYHAMAWLAVAPLSDLVPGESSLEPCFLVQNSWGEWNGGPMGKYDIPDGSFWIDTQTARGMLSQGQAIAVGEFVGYAPEPLADWGFELFTRRPKIFSIPSEPHFSLAP